MATGLLAPPVRSALRAVARHGLAEDRGGAPPVPLDDRDWRRLLTAVVEERLTGLLDRAVADGALPATAAQAEAAEERAAAFLRGTLRLERALTEVAACLRRAGVAFLVLKGPAVARLDETNPALRHYVDLDLLVPGDDVEAAVAALAALGYRRDLPERRPGFDRHFAKEVSLASPEGPEVDVHRTLVLGAFGLRLDLAAFWESTSSFSVGGTGLAALDAEARFVHACLNAVLGDERPRLVALRDVARISTAHRLRPARLRRLAPPGRGAAAVAAAVAECRATLGAPVGAEAGALAAEVVASRWERAALRAYRSRGGSNTLELLSGVLGVTGVDRLRYLRGLLVPDAAYVDARRRAGRPDEWGAGLREVARRRPSRRAGVGA